MNRNVKLAIVAVLLVALGGGGLYVLYKGYKKYRPDKPKEVRYGGTLGEAPEGFDVEGFKKSLLADDLLEQVIVKHDLVKAWGMDDVAAAKSRIRQKFTVEHDGAMVKVAYQDKNKEIALGVMQSIMKIYYQKMKAAKDQ